jgi:hypothetical protein
METFIGNKEIIYFKKFGAATTTVLGPSGIRPFHSCRVNIAGKFEPML